MSVVSIIDAIEAGVLGVPEFQRDFEWEPTAIADLVRTVARNWPCGTFLMQQDVDEYESRPIQGAPSLLPRPTYLLLDGQQRVTALYHVMKDRGDERYYIDMNSLIESGELDDDYVQYESAKRFMFRFPSLASEAESGIARISTLCRDEEFFQWLSFLAAGSRQAALRCRSQQLAGLKYYTIPTVLLPKSTPLSAVVRIFETLNRGGVPLDVFDLMVARLHPQGFKLRDENNAIARDYPVLAEFEIVGVEVLRYIALLEHLRESTDNLRGKIRGVRKSDVIDLPGETVKLRWQDSLVALERALVHLRDQCGLITPALLQSSLMVMPAALAMARDDVGVSTLRGMVRWYWSAGFSQSYAQGANTQVIADARRLASGMLEFPSFIEPLDRAAIWSGLRDTRRRNDILLKTTLAALVVRGARDLVTGAKLIDCDEGCEIVPLFAPRWLDASNQQTGKLLANFILLRKSSKQKLVGKDLGKALKEGLIVKDALISQCISVEKLSQSLYADAILQRREALIDFVDAFLLDLG